MLKNNRQNLSYLLCCSNSNQYLYFKHAYLTKILTTFCFSLLKVDLSSVPTLLERDGQAFLDKVAQNSEYYTEKYFLETE